MLKLQGTRVQLLLLTVAGAFAYLALLPNADPGSLPAVPQELLLLFGGSASIYVGGKGARLVLSQLLRPTPTVPPNTETDAQ